MTTLTEVVAAVVMHSSTVAFSHFGIVLEPVQIERPAPAVERVVARSPRKANKLTDCPEQPARAKAIKA
ncbi:MAG: hypothetical protein ABW360_07155 [Phenylobacterium sp.]